MSIWKPRFISHLVAEDRGHLNGVADRDGKPRYVLAVANSDTFDGWRDRRNGGGLVIDTANDETVCSNLSMPHSSRWRDGRLWLHNSGTGEFGFVELNSGSFAPICFCLGYLRGLDFIGDFAVMGLSKPRDNKAFTGLSLDRHLADRRMNARCGIYVVDLKAGHIAHSLTVEGLVSKIYDVAVIPGKLQPAVLGPKSTELRRIVSVDNH